MKPPLKISLKSKLFISMLSFVILTGIGAYVIGRIVVHRNIIAQAYENVAKALEMYGSMYFDKLYIKQRLLNVVAGYPTFQYDVRNRNQDDIYQVVKELLKETHFDILNVTDQDGIILVRSKNYPLSGDKVSDDLYVGQTLRDHQTHFGFDVMSHKNLEIEGNDLAQRATIQVVPTERARPSGKQVEDRGLVLKVVVPIFDQKDFVGTIYGALLLNNENEFPDRTQQLIFGDEKINGKEVGSATLFLDDLRISTSIRNKDGKRAIGTLVSKEVYEQVFQKGNTWIDEAFVVDRYYIAAYKPVKNFHNETLGIIYTGILKEKYNIILRNTETLLLSLTLTLAIIAIFLVAYLVHYFINPVQSLVASANEIIKGNYLHVKINTRDEMGYLGYVFNKMVDALIEKDKRLMEHAEQQILQTEKLASLGRLSSGIAHEINNPLTGVLVYSSALLKDLKETEYAPDLQVIVEETLRCRAIVKGILDFARESNPKKVSANLNDIILNTLQILEKHVSFQNIKIVKELQPDLPDALIDINQMKSVINNLAVNAADAMHNSGTLTVGTKVSPDGNDVIMKISDTGVGIPEENISKVFDPFFTTKETGKGTGLGLAVTYGIIKRHNGFINISSKVGVGTTVRVQIPISYIEET